MLLTMNEPTQKPFRDDLARTWEERYQNQDTFWELNQPAPAFVSLLDSVESPQLGKVAVLGSGTGNDAFLFAKAGFEVVGFDFAPTPIAIARERALKMKVETEFLQLDILTLGDEFANTFDYVVEHTCFSAILPQQRDRYVEAARSLLKPKGIFLGVFYTHSRPGGPPFGSTPEEIANYFQPSFEVMSLAPVKNSVPKRLGEEHFGQFRRSI